MENMRPADRADLQQMIQIERASFDDPWTAEEFIQHFNCKSVSSIVVCERQGEIDEVVGYLFYQCLKQHINIVSMAVSPIYQRKGKALAMLTKVMEKTSPTRRKVIAVVRETNLPAQLLFKKAGFLATKIIRKPFDNSDDDGFIFEYKKPSSKNNVKGNQNVAE